MGDETDETIDELIEFFSQNYPKDLEESVRESDFIFDSVNLLIYSFIYLFILSLKDTKIQYNIQYKTVYNKSNV